MTQPLTRAIIVNACAQAAHEMNRVYCREIGDTVSPPWEDDTESQRDCLRQGVEGVFAGNTPQKSHENWLRVRTEQGWQYGPVKDPVAKTSPCFLPYDELPPQQKAKDQLFLSTVKAVAEALGSPIS